MGAGLQRATLEALCTQGPWVVIRHRKGYRVFPEELRAVYAFLQSETYRANRNSAPWSTPEAKALVDFGNRQKPRLAFILQALRKAGLIVYREGAWTPIGDLP
jgi:hypothetical protein